MSPAGPQGRLRRSRRPESLEDSATVREAFTPAFEPFIWVAKRATSSSS